MTLTTLMTPITQNTISREAPAGSRDRSAGLLEADASSGER